MEFICQTKNQLNCDLLEFVIDCDLNESKEQHLVDCIDVAWMHLSQLNSLVYEDQRIRMRIRFK